LVVEVVVLTVAVTLVDVVFQSISVSFEIFQPPGGSTVYVVETMVAVVVLLVVLVVEEVVDVEVVDTKVVEVSGV